MLIDNQLRIWYMGFFACLFCSSFFPGKEKCLNEFQFSVHFLCAQICSEEKQFDSPSKDSKTFKPHRFGWKMWTLFALIRPFLHFFNLRRGDEQNKRKTHFSPRCERHQLTLVTRNYSKQDWDLKKPSGNNCSARFELTCILYGLHQDMIYKAGSPKLDSRPAYRREQNPVHLKCLMS